MSGETEVATSIDTLDSNQPLAGGPAAHGDDHIRMLKDVLKSTFQNWPASPGTDYTALMARLDDIENAIDALNDRIDNECVKFTPSTSDVAIAGKIQSAGVKSTTTLEVLGTTTLQNVSAQEVTAVVKVTSPSYKGGSVSVSGDVTAFNGE